MKLISQNKAIEKLSAIRSELAEKIRGDYEVKAKPCSACTKPGICCQDSHFVNVRITRLEAVAIRQRLDALEGEFKEKIYRRIDEVIDRYRLDQDTELIRTYACPLFEPGVGCLVHDTAKPLPCIAHACYENVADLPPDELLEKSEAQVAKLNRRVYGKDMACSPIPLAIARA